MYRWLLLVFAWSLAASCNSLLRGGQSDREEFEVGGASHARQILPVPVEPSSRADAIAVTAPAAPNPVAEARAKIEAFRQESIEIAQRLGENYPNSTDAMGLLGMVYNRLDNTAKARESWQAALRHNPNRADIYDSLATVAIRDGEFQQAAEFCRAGLAKSGAGPELHRHLAEALLGLGSPEEARDELQTTLKLAPQDPLAHELLGKAFTLLGQFDQAKANYEAVLKTAPDDPAALYGLGTACARLGLEDQSRQAFERQQKTAAEAAKSARSKRDVTFDVAKFQHVLSLTCSDAASVYAGHQRLGKAEVLLRRGIEVDSQDVSCRAKLSLLMINLGHPQEAVAFCRQMITTEPKNPELHRILALVFAALQRSAEARGEAERAIDLAPDNEEYRSLLTKLKHE